MERFGGHSLFYDGGSVAKISYDDNGKISSRMVGNYRVDGSRLVIEGQTVNALGVAQEDVHIERTYEHGIQFSKDGTDYTFSSEAYTDHDTGEINRIVVTDKDGNSVETIYKDGNRDTAVTRDRQGDILSTSVFSHVDNNMFLPEKETITYKGGATGYVLRNNSGGIIKEFVPGVISREEDDVISIEKEYGSGGNVIRKTEIYGQYKAVNEYNIDGSVKTYELFNNNDGSRLEKNEFHYDNEGVLSEKVIVVNDKYETKQFVETYNKDGTARVERRYYRKGELFSTTEYSYGKYEVSGKMEGFLSREIETFVDGSRLETHYNPEGNITRETYYNPEGDITSFISIDENGNKEDLTEKINNSDVENSDKDQMESQEKDNTDIGETDKDKDTIDAEKQSSDHESDSLDNEKDSKQTEDIDKNNVDRKMEAEPVEDAAAKDESESNEKDIEKPEVDSDGQIESDQDPSDTSANDEPDDEQGRDHSAEEEQTEDIDTVEVSDDSGENDTNNASYDNDADTDSVVSVHISGDEDGSHETIEYSSPKQDDEFKDAGVESTTIDRDDEGNVVHTVDKLDNGYVRETSYTLDEDDRRPVELQEKVTIGGDETAVVREKTTIYGDGVDVPRDKQATTYVDNYEPDFGTRTDSSKTTYEYSSAAAGTPAAGWSANVKDFMKNESREVKCSMDENGKPEEYSEKVKDLYTGETKAEVSWDKYTNEFTITKFENGEPKSEDVINGSVGKDGKPDLEAGLDKAFAEIDKDDRSSLSDIVAAVGGEIDASIDKVFSIIEERSADGQVEGIKTIDIDVQEADEESDPVDNDRDDEDQINDDWDEWDRDAVC